MRRFVDRSEESRSRPLLNDNETISYELNGVKLAFSVEKSEGLGNLFVTTRRFIWISNENEKAYDFDVTYVILHAITRDVSSYPDPCLYCQLDSEDYVENDHDSENEDNDNEGDDDLMSPTEMYLVPEDSSQLQALFDAFSAAAMANPDEDNEYDSNLIYNMDEVHLGSEQAAALAHLESVFTPPEEDQDANQFEDCEDQ